MTVTKLGSYYFTYYEDRTAVVGNITKESSPRAVDDCSIVNNENVTIPPTITVNEVEYTVTSLYDMAFFKCEIHSITLPNTLKSIGLSAIDLTYIENPIILPESLEYIGDWAISAACFTSIRIPSNVSYIGNGAIGCNSKLTNIEVSPNNPYFTIENGILYDKSLTTIIQAETNLQSITIPESVRVIQAAAFSWCNITELVIPVTVKIINQQIIDSCENLKRLYILGNPQFVGNKPIGSTNENVEETLELVFYQGSKAVIKDIFGKLNVTKVVVCNGYQSEKFSEKSYVKYPYCQAYPLPLTCHVSFSQRSYNLLYIAIALI